MRATNLVRIAPDGFNIAIAAKDSPAQIQETVEGISAAGGEVLACDMDVRDCAQLKNLASQTIARFGGIDTLVNNTSAPCFNDTFYTSPEQ